VQTNDRTAAARTAPADRRRPGRPDAVDPHLVPLLRFKPSADQIGTAQAIPSLPEAPGSDTAADDADDADDADGLRAARGIALAAGISAALWAMLGALAVWG